MKINTVRVWQNGDARMSSIWRQDPATLKVHCHKMYILSARNVERLEKALLRSDAAVTFSPWNSEGLVGWSATITRKAE